MLRGAWRTAGTDACRPPSRPVPRRLSHSPSFLPCGRLLYRPRALAFHWARPPHTRLNAQEAPDQGHEPLRTQGTGCGRPGERKWRRFPAVRSKPSSAEESLENASNAGEKTNKKLGAESSLRWTPTFTSEQAPAATHGGSAQATALPLWDGTPQEALGPVLPVTLSDGYRSRPRDRPLVENRRGGTDGHLGREDSPRALSRGGFHLLGHRAALDTPSTVGDWPGTARTPMPGPEGSALASGLSAGAGGWQAERHSGQRGEDGKA